MMVDFYHFKFFEKYNALVHMVTKKSMQFPYTFSLALHTGENKKEIIQNREILSAALSRKGKFSFVVANQTHSDHIEVIEYNETKGWKSLESAIANCDALITNLRGVVLTVLTADCVPVLLYDKKQNVVAAVHAGWRGTQAKIVFKTVQKMKKVYGSNPSDIIVGIAPAIGRCCYEVGEDVGKHFLETPEGFTKVNEKYMLDLPLINKKQLLDAGVKEENIEMSHICTACDSQSFFSYRKEQGCTGRFMSMIGLL
jgi:YfiH family protein